MQSLTGISQLTLDPTGGTNQDTAAQIAIQQRVSGNLVITFSSTSTQNQAVQVQYQPSKRFSVSVIRDQYGGYALDLIYHKVLLKIVLRTAGTSRESEALART